MRLTKVVIKNLFGIKEVELNGASVECSGKNGAGKTSVIDAIKYALTNKSDRDYIVRQGETEGEILIETDSGLRINRKARTNQADYKSVKQNGREVGSPESFLKEIFTPLQLNPVEFMEMDKKEQNATILNLIEYPWDLVKIKEWFGEIPSWVSYDQNILSVLNDIQSEKGEYFQQRQEINRDIRNKRAFITEIAESIPANYDVSAWELANVGDVYREIEAIRKNNEMITKAQAFIANRSNKMRGYEAEKEISLAAIDTEFVNEEKRLDKDIATLTEQIKALNDKKATLAERKADKVAVVEQKYKADMASLESLVNEYMEYAGKELISTTELEEQAKYIEEMKSHINEYRRMINLEEEVEELVQTSEELTAKIERARTLPGEILSNCTIPVEGLTVENGIPLINGLPISNLSEGEKLDLCIDVAIQNPSGLQIILIDGVEKLATELRNKLYEKCKTKGLQFIATRTTDDDYMTIAEL